MRSWLAAFKTNGRPPSASSLVRPSPLRHATLTTHVLLFAPGTVSAHPLWVEEHFSRALSRGQGEESRPRLVETGVANRPSSDRREHELPRLRLPRRDQGECRKWLVLYFSEFCGKKGLARLTVSWKNAGSLVILMHLIPKIVIASDNRTAVAPAGSRSCSFRIDRINRCVRCIFLSRFASSRQGYTYLVVTRCPLLQCVYCETMTFLLFFCISPTAAKRTVVRVVFVFCKVAQMLRLLYHRSVHSSCIS